MPQLMRTSPPAPRSCNKHLYSRVLSRRPTGKNRNYCGGCRSQVEVSSRGLPGLQGWRVKTRINPRGLLEQEAEELHLSSKVRSLLEKFVPKTANHSATEPLSAA